jgi:aspartyl aminopeptidase
MITMFDHEEVGSLSAQGAESPFFSETLERAAAALGVSDYFAFKARSFQISSDMAHAVRIVPLK